jgi:hypothetical protein
MICTVVAAPGTEAPWNSVDGTRFQASLTRMAPSGTRPDRTCRIAGSDEHGVGPHPEDLAVKTVLAKMQLLRPGVYEAAHARLSLEQSRLCYED